MRKIGDTDTPQMNQCQRHVQVGIKVLPLITLIALVLPCQISSFSFPYPQIPHVQHQISSSKFPFKFTTLTLNTPPNSPRSQFFFKSLSATNTPISIPEKSSSEYDYDFAITEIDMRYNREIPLIYDPTLNRYINTRDTPQNKLTTLFSLSYLSHFFLPSSVTPSYYQYIRWRILQRYINAIVHVLGTQSLLMGLGFKSSKVGFASASLTWVCKDALGKIARMIWASKMGQRFDSDSKRWRFRSSLVFAFGNGLEICALAFPKWFLVWATLSNAMKQMSMLTSSATRNALYNSFSVGGTGASAALSKAEKTKAGVPNSSKLKFNAAQISIAEQQSSASNQTQSRGAASAQGGGENIGDITAKGEAQIAVVDLLGIASGICLSKLIGVRVRNVLFTWLILQVCEIACMYKEIRSVVFRVLNFERLWHIVDKFVDMNLGDEEDFIQLFHPSNNTKSRANSTTVTTKRKRRRKTISFYSDEEKYKRQFIPTPIQVAQDEKIFLPPETLARRASCFGSFGRTHLTPLELKAVMDIFEGDKFLLIVGGNIKKHNNKKSMRAADPREHCHVVLHKDATNMDIVKSTLAIGILRQCLSKQYSSQNNNMDAATSTIIRTKDCIAMLQLAKDISDEWFPRFLKTLQSRGWATPTRYMFGKVTMRADWPIVSTTMKSAGVNGVYHKSSSQTPQEQLEKQLGTNITSVDTFKKDEPATTIHDAMQKNRTSAEMLQ